MILRLPSAYHLHPSPYHRAFRPCRTPRSRAGRPWALCPRTGDVRSTGHPQDVARPGLPTSHPRAPGIVPHGRAPVATTATCIRDTRLVRKEGFLARRARAPPRTGNRNPQDGPGRAQADAEPFSSNRRYGATCRHSWSRCSTPTLPFVGGRSPARRRPGHRVGLHKLPLGWPDRDRVATGGCLPAQDGPNDLAKRLRR